MTATATRWKTAFNVAAVLAGSWLLADSVNAVTASRLPAVAPLASSPGRVALSRTARPDVAMFLDPIVEKNVFNHGEPVPGMDLPDEPVVADAPAQACTLPVKVLSVVLVPSDPGLNLATVLDNAMAPPRMRVVQVGETFDETARLHRVYEDREGNPFSPVAVIEVLRESGRLEVCRSDDAAPPAPDPRVRRTGGPAVAAGPTGAGIKKLSETNFEIAQAEVDAALSGGMMNEARNVLVVPYFENGKASGFKLARIKPASILHKIGLKSGDILRKVNGYDISSPEKALQVYSMLRNEKSISVDVTRGGKNTSLSYSIR